MHINEEKKLVKLARSGDKEAFGELMNLYSNKIYGLSLKLSKSDITAQDLTQETFITALKKISKFREDMHLMDMRF